KESIQMARTAKDARTEAIALNNLANLHSYQGKFDEATRAYKASMDAAASAGDAELAAQACANLAHTCFNAADYGNAKAWAGRVVERAGRLPDSHGKAYRFLSAGRTFNDVFLAAPDHENKLRLRALDAFKKAAATAEAIGDKRALSYALGYQGEL